MEKSLNIVYANSQKVTNIWDLCEQVDQQLNQEQQSESKFFVNNSLDPQSEELEQLKLKLSNLQNQRSDPDLKDQKSEQSRIQELEQKLNNLRNGEINANPNSLEEGDLDNSDLIPDMALIKKEQEALALLEGQIQNLQLEIKGINSKNNRKKEDHQVVILNLERQLSYLNKQTQQFKDEIKYYELETQKAKDDLNKVQERKNFLNQELENIKADIDTLIEKRVEVTTNYIRELATVRENYLAKLQNLRQTHLSSIKDLQNKHLAEIEQNNKDFTDSLEEIKNETKKVMESQLNNLLDIDRITREAMSENPKGLWTFSCTFVTKKRNERTEYLYSPPAYTPFIHDDYKDAAVWSHEPVKSGAWKLELSGYGGYYIKNYSDGKYLTCPGDSFCLKKVESEYHNDNLIRHNEIPDPYKRYAITSSQKTKWQIAYNQEYQTYYVYTKIYIEGKERNAYLNIYEDMHDDSRRKATIYVDEKWPWKIKKC